MDRHYIEDMKVAAKTQRNCPGGGPLGAGGKDCDDFLPMIKLVG